MSKSDRFFEIIQMLRAAKRPLLARDMADELEVSKRTIYRDIATLQAMQTPIVGEAGVGYVIRKGYDLPPINVDIDEAEAIAIGLSMVARTGDVGLWRAARRASRKLHEASAGTRRLIASSWGVTATPAVDSGLLRRAIRDERTIRLGYQNANADASERIVWPLALIYYVDTAVLVGWCELRQDVRHFRLDRISACAATGDTFHGQGEALIARWEETEKAKSVSTTPL
ncbi:YafY family protein [Gammaproteobacteria bacterium]|nr:YafY family protein [Gammaproteobacteria bacterium]